MIGCKVSQCKISHVGTTLDNEELKRLRALAEYIKSNIESENQHTLFTLKKWYKLQ